MAHASNDSYYIPHGSHWPLVGSVGLFTMLAGAANWLKGSSTGVYILAIGALTIIYMVFGWFGTVIRESEAGIYNDEVDSSFRMGMMWFIFSEVMFFAVFFGVLFYARTISIPWLGGDSNNFFTNTLLWESFTAEWPTNGPGNMGGEFEPMPPWPLPTINTIILLTSGATITAAHHAIQAGHRRLLTTFLGLTWVLGFIFMACQAYEYYEAYAHLNLTLSSGMYGATFFMLTGFHGLHVTIGAIILLVIWLRCLRGHFTPEHHFGFEAAAWYWHFVDVVWLALYIFVYWV